jgi:Ran GTPase-activating protein (RanGAP) involved in mRNA processing and transport
MSDTDPDADAISDASNSHSDEALISVAVRELCNRLRANDPGILEEDPTFELMHHLEWCSEAECIAVFQALKENTSVERICFSSLFERQYTERSALVIAEYMESSTTLKTLDLSYGRHGYLSEGHEMTSTVLRILSRNTSVTELNIDTDVVKFASVALQELLTRTQTLQKLEMFGHDFEAFNEVHIDAITSGFANNTTLRDLEFQSWREADLAPMLIALQRHPALKKIHISAGCSDISFQSVPSLSGLEVLLRSQDSKVKELILEQVGTRTVGLPPVLQELGRNTTVTHLSICDSVLSRENFQEVKSMLRHNTALQYLNLASSALKSVGLAEIAPVLYRNTSIKTLDLSNIGLDDIESTNVLRELLRRNKTISSLCLRGNAFGRDVAAARSIFESLRCNTALQQLDLSHCELDDQGISNLANALAVRDTSILELNIQWNRITSVGVRALVEDNVEAVKTLTKLCLASNPFGRGSEVAIILADALERNTMPNVKELDLDRCGIDDDGFVALVSSLEQNTALQKLELRENSFGKLGFVALAESLPNIKGLQEIHFSGDAGFQSTLPLLLEGFRKNTSLVEVAISPYELEEWSRELKFLGQRNRFTPLLKASDPPDVSPQLGIWSRALAKVATEPDVLFHVLHNKPKLVESAAGGSKKRKCNDE